ncbi:hypothetical protein BMS3Abin15_00429 [bacterium BMS3Abin15]|nr:hypothetical protein BMS3Abin15_00429 [bacterium BMS3Abin15]HDZ85043.1 hypothetical protein [Candidatus Moranbacteria bacterium]
MSESNDIEYGPTRETKDIADEKKALAALVKELTFEELKDVQKRLSYSVEIKEGEDEKKAMEDFLVGLINGEGNNLNTLEDIRKKIELTKGLET